MATNTTHATSQASVSESNRSRIVKHLYHNGIISRAQIAKALELTPAAITKITARLIEAGMIEETGDLEGSKNRRSIGLKLDTTRFHHRHQIRPLAGADRRVRPVRQHPEL